MNIEILNVIIKSVLDMVFFMLLLTPIFNKKLTALICCVSFSLVFSVCLLFLSSIWRPIFVSLLILIIVLTLFRDNIFKKLGIYAFFIIINYFCEFIAVLILSGLYNISPERVLSNDYRGPGLLIFLIILAAVFALLYFVINRSSLHFTTSEWVRYLFFPISQMVIIIGLFSRTVKYPESYNIILLWIDFILIILSNVFLIKVFASLRKNTELESKTAYMEKELQIQLNHYQELIEQIDMTKKHRHDIANHLQTINSLIKNNNIKKVSEYIEHICEEFSLTEAIIFTNYPIADAVISNKLAIMKKNNIKFQINSSIPPNIIIKDVDIVGILSNLLDNAIEACINCDIPNKYIVINIYVKADVLLINIENSKSKISTKKAVKDPSFTHGLGLEIVGSICKKYNGTLTIKNNDDSFLAIASINLN